MPEPKKSNRNRTAGHAYELKTIKKLKPIFPHAASSRSCNRARDGEKVDIVNYDEFANGRIPVNVQCKDVTGAVKYHSLLKELPTNPGVINVVFHNYRVKKGTKFYTAGEFAITHVEDFVELLRCKEELLQLKQLRNESNTFLNKQA